MTLNLADKKAVVAELSEVVDTAISAAAADYRGLTVSEMDALRVKARGEGIKVRVYRNTLARRAMKETHFACLTDALVGPIMLFFADDEPGAPARLLRDFAKEHDNFEVRALALDGKLFGPEQLAVVADLPSRDQALGQLLSVMKAPITKLVRTLNEPAAQCVRVLSAIKDEKQANA